MNDDNRPRQVVLYQLLSLDGVAEDPGEGDWLVDADERLVDNLARVIERQDTVLLGRGTFDMWAGHWPTSDMQPFADFINGTRKVVFTSSPTGRDWSGATYVDEPAGPYVARLKQEPGGDIGIHGSIRLAQSLLREGLVDELRLVVAPTLAGSGRRLFEDTGTLQRFELVDVDRSGHCLLLGYRLRPHGPSSRSGQAS